MVDTFKAPESSASLDQDDNKKIKKQCTYNMLWYSHGDQICFDGEIHECDNGVWIPIGFKCK